MAFQRVEPFDAAAADTGISCSLNIAPPRRPYFRLSFNEKAQTEIFGGSLNGRAFSVKVGHGEDAGILALIPDPAGPHVFKKTARGAVMVKIKPWATLPKVKQLGTSVSGKLADAGRLEIVLPSWCIERRPASGSAITAPSSVSSAAQSGVDKARAAMRPGRG